MGIKGSRHRCLDYRAYQRNLPRSPLRPGDTVLAGGEPAVAVSKNYLKATWVVRFADGRCGTYPESALTLHTGCGNHTDHEP
jgi:hypothetical protein